MDNLLNQGGEEEVIEQEIVEQDQEDETLETLGDELEDDGEEQEAPEIKMTTWTDDEGNEWEIPAAITPALMKNKDYTTKTQEVSEQKKALVAEKEAWKLQQQRDEEDKKLDSELFSVERDLEKYKNIDWDAEYERDPDNAQRHFMKAQQLNARKQDLTQQQQGRVQEKSQAAQQEVAKRFEEAKDWAVKNIPNYGPELLSKLDAYTESLGIDDAFLRANMSTKFMRVLYDGFVGHEVRSKAATKKPVKTNVTPLKQIKAKSAGTNRIDLSTASMDDYAAARRKGVGG